MSYLPVQAVVELLVSIIGVEGYEVWATNRVLHRYLPGGLFKCYFACGIPLFRRRASAQGASLASIKEKLLSPGKEDYRFF